ncbi:MAG: hypothetical protein WAN14_11150 [Candidatus Acidiferrales bacterium]
MVIQHLIALFLIVIAPAKSVERIAREDRHYRTMVIVGWLTSVIALVAVGWRAILTFNRDSANVSWLPQHSGSRTFCGRSPGAAFHHRSFSPTSPA